MIRKLEDRIAKDHKDREYDSDDEIKAAMKTYDDRLTFINKVDARTFGATKEIKAPEKVVDKTPAEEDQN